ncbi:MAG: DUF4362 domain-containing protein [Clostridia bacterium]|nr:DUF4362 domain-containing protein [Clostridia bacterium]
MKDLTEKQKMFIIYVFVALFIVGIFLGIFVGLSRKNREENAKNNETIIEEEVEKLEPIPMEDCINNGYFVIDTANNKIYNKDVLDRFVENTGLNSKNRIADKIRIVNYNIDGAPTIYDLEYKIFDETYIGVEQKEVNKTGYILTTDTRHTTFENENINNRHSITIDDDIPGEFYGIILMEHSDINAISIELGLYAEINYVDVNAKIYDNIEITRYSMDAEVVKSKTTEEIEKYTSEIQKVDNEINEKIENE